MRPSVLALLPVLFFPMTCLAGEAPATATPTDPQAATPAAGQARSLSPAEMMKGTRDQVDAMAARLTRDGGPAEEWLLLARSYLQFKEYAKAEDAARRAIAMKPKDVEARTVLAEAQIDPVPHGQRLPAGFVATMREILDLDPTSIGGLYYIGLAESQDGHADKARTLWTRLLDVLPAGDARRDEVGKRLAALPPK